MLRCVSRAIAFVSIVTAVSLPIHRADATLIQVGSRSALDANLDVDWSAFGPAGTSLSCFCSETVNGLTVGINGTSGVVDRLEEGTDYTGDFAKGDELISQPFTSDQLSVGGFSSPVSAIGTQIQPLAVSSSTGVEPSLGFVGPFTATMEVFTDDGPPAVFTVSGAATEDEDDSALFIGVISTTNDITGVNFAVDIGNGSEGALAINELDVRVPEPTSTAVLGTAVILLIGLLHCRRIASTGNAA